MSPQHLRLVHTSKTVWPFQPTAECSELPWGCCGIVWLLGKQHHIGEANCPLSPITTHQPLPQLALITLWPRTWMMTQPVCRAGQIAVVNVSSRQHRQDTAPLGRTQPGSCSGGSHGLIDAWHLRGLVPPMGWRKYILQCEMTPGHQLLCWTLTELHMWTLMAILGLMFGMH